MVDWRGRSAVETAVGNTVDRILETQTMIAAPLGDAAAGRHFQGLLEAAKERGRHPVHAFHRYFGKLIPAIPRFAIEALCPPGGRVLDPFCGSGTTLVEACLAGREAWGVDMNPLSVLVARAKTDPPDMAEAVAAMEQVVERVNDWPGRERVPEPPLPNAVHWFRPEVWPVVCRLRAAVDQVDGPVGAYLLACLSAAIRDVSNADPRHVFPGYSKRLRALDAQGLRPIDPLARFSGTARRRLKASAAYLAALPRPARATVLAGDARSLPPAVPSVDLIVTNPPYIGSIRYLETLKIELFCTGFMPDRATYLALDRQVVASERFSKGEYTQATPTGLPGVDAVAEQVRAAGHPKMALAVARYFQDMDRVLGEMARLLRPGGHAVIKISNSYVRALTIPVHALLAALAARHGLPLLAAFPDPIRRRSLLTRRNTYSGMLEADWILILRRDPADV